MSDRVAALGPRDQIKELRQQGIDLCSRGFYQDAIKAFQKALFLARTPEVNAEIYCDLGVVYRYLNQLDMADDVFDYILRNDPTDRIRAISFIEQAIVRLRKLDHQAALEKISKADEIAIDDVILLTHLKSTFGRVYASMCDYRNALDKFNKAYSFIEPHQGASAVPVILNNIGDCYIQLGDYSRGEEFIHRALNLAKERKNNRCVTECLVSLMDTAVRQEAVERAKAYGKKAIAIARSFNFTDLISDVEYRLANIYREEGNEKISDFFYNRVLQSHKNLNSEVLNILAKTG